MRVLLVDDERLSLSLMADGLRNHDYHVTEAEGGMEALQIWTPGAFDIIVTDIRMPGLNGIDLARRICQRNSDESDSNVLTLAALTGNMNFVDDTGDFGQLFDLVLKKPISVDAVARSLADHANRPGAD